MATLGQVLKPKKTKKKSGCKETTETLKPFSVHKQSKNQIFTCVSSDIPVFFL